MSARIMDGRKDSPFVPTLVLPPRDTVDARAIQGAALAAGWQVERLASWRAPAALQEKDLVVYGEPLFIDVVTPALDLAVLDVPWDWTATLPPDHRQREVRFTTLREAATCTTAAFIKPTEDKSFPARIYTTGAELGEATVMLPSAMPVVTSEPVSWDIEFRCFVLDRRVVAFAPYLREGEPIVEADGTWPRSVDESGEALTYTTALLQDPGVALPAAIVVDVGRIHGRGWAVVEANGAWGSGLYGCDPASVLPVLARATRRRQTLTPEDARWARTQYIVA